MSWNDDATLATAEHVFFGRKVEEQKGNTSEKNWEFLIFGILIPQSGPQL